MLKFPMSSRRLLPLSLLFLILIALLAGRKLAPASAFDQEVSPAIDPVLPKVLMPLIRGGRKPLPPPVPKYGDPPLNFDALAAGLESQGQILSFNKIGFHVGSGRYHPDLGNWMQTLDAAGVPFFLKSADDDGRLLEAQALMQSSGVPHTLVFRLTTAGQNDGNQYDVPPYHLDPVTAASVHWQIHKAKLPAGLDRDKVWIETINEVDKGRSEWLAQFALATAKLTLQDGYRWAAFGWASGEPEPEHWTSPSMLAFLSLAAQHPDQLAIALHEYSYTVDDIGNIYPYFVGRFQFLFQACDDHGIDRPTVLISEWGWEAFSNPAPQPALADIAWAAKLYAAFPQVKGAAIWYLGPGFLGIAEKYTEPLILPLKDYGLANYFEVVPGPGQIAPDLLAP